MKKENKGFTIVELLVVMSVIAILITMSVVGIQQVQKSTRASRANNNALLLKAQLESYYNEFRQYPVTLGIDTTNQKIYLCSVGQTCSSSSDQYVFSSIPIDQPGVNLSSDYSQAGPQAGLYSYAPHCEVELTDGTINADTWKLFYEPKTLTRPQEFYLATCTEFGWKEFSKNPLSDQIIFIPPPPVILPPPPAI